jgi:hypothetical protein
MKKTAIVLFLLASLPCLAQTDNTFYAKQFQGTTVGAKVTAAQLACNSNTAIPCIIVLDPSLAVYPVGIMPAKCAQCSWIDYRSGTSFGPAFTVPVTAPRVQGIVSPTAFTDTAIQAAIDSLPSTGGEVYLPVGTYSMCSALPILINKPIKFHGAGQNGTILSVCSILSSSTSVFLVQAPISTVLVGVEISDIGIYPASGTPGNSAISLDALSGGEVHSIYIHHIATGQFGGAAISSTGAVGAGNGIPAFGSRIEQSILIGGISLPNAGDTMHIGHNIITGSGYSLNISFVPGASSLFFDHNSVTSLGGVHIGTAAIAIHIVDNEIEAAMAGFTGSNGSLVDIDGSSGSIAQSIEVARNSFQVTNGITANGLRVNYAINTNIYGNNFERGATTSCDISVTANAASTLIGTNMWYMGGPFSKMLCDSGASTMVLILGGNGGPLINNNSPLQYVNEIGAYNVVLNMSTDGTVYLYGYRSNPIIWGGAATNTFFTPQGSTGMTLNNTTGAMFALPLSAPAFTTTGVSTLLNGLTPIIQGSNGSITGGLYAITDVAGGNGIGLSFGYFKQNIGLAQGGKINGITGDWLLGTTTDCGQKLCVDGQIVNANGTVPAISTTTPTVGAGVCWKSATTLGTCTAGTWPNCTTCN